MTSPAAFYLTTESYEIAEYLSYSLVLLARGWIGHDDSVYGYISVYISFTMRGHIMVRS